MNLKSTYRSVKEAEAEQRQRAEALEETVASLEQAVAELTEAEAKSSQVAEELAAKVAKLSSSESGMKKKAQQLEKQALENEVKQAALAGAEESARESVAALELKLERLTQEHSSLREVKLPDLEQLVERLTVSNAEYEATIEAQRVGAEALGFDLEALLGSFSRVTELQREVVELEEANADLQQGGELAKQQISALEVDLEDTQERAESEDRAGR